MHSILVLFLLASYAADPAPALAESSVKPDDEVRWAFFHFAEFDSVRETTRNLSMYAAVDEKGNRFFRTTSAEKGDEFYCCRSDGSRLGQYRSGNFLFLLNPEELCTVEKGLTCLYLTTPPQNDKPSREGFDAYRCLWIMLNSDRLEQFNGPDIAYKQNDRAFTFEPPKDSPLGDVAIMKMTISKDARFIESLKLDFKIHKTWKADQIKLNRWTEGPMSDFVETIGGTKEIREFFRKTSATD